MDIPFTSSGALSRAHYGIVSKVETASSPQYADQMLALEVKATHQRLSQRSLKSVRPLEAFLVDRTFTFRLTEGVQGVSGHPALLRGHREPWVLGTRCI
jgi:hypothetical protein